MKHSIIALLICLALFANVGYAQRAISLEKALQMGLEHSQSLKNAELDKRIAKNDVDVIKSTGLPQLSVGGNFTANPQPQVTPIITDEFGGLPPGVEPQVTTLAFGRPMSATASISFSQLLFDGSYFLGLKAARQYVNMANLNADLSETEVKADLINAYYLAVLSGKNVSRIMESIDVTKTLVGETKAMYKEGMVEKTDVDRLQLALAKLNNQLALASNNAEVALMSLKMKLGIEQTAEIVLTDGLQNEVQADLLTATFDKNDRVEAKMLDQQIKLQELNVKRYEFSRYPSFFLQASHQQQSVYFDREGFNDQFLTTWYPGTSVALNINVPIFTGLKTKTQIDKAQNELEKAKNTADQTMDMLELEYNNSRLTYTQKWKAYQLQVQAVGLANEIFRTAQIKYKEGVGSSFEMIQAQQDLIQAEIQLTAAAYDLINSETNLKKSLGKL